jgi:hypothetical protein
MAYARKMLIHGRRPEPHDYRLARRALELIADRIGRGGGQGRPMRWRLKSDQSVAKAVASRKISQ